jgi:hypothetical protein
VVKILPLVLFFILLLFAGNFAITQEVPEADSDPGDSVPPDMLFDDLAYDFQENDEELQSGWIVPGPPRWFRSNAGGMALEETPSRLAALRNEYTLVIDYVSPDELEPRLLQFYQSGYIVEIRVLYKQGVETRKQWLLRDSSSNTRLNAVFRQQPEQPELDPAKTNEDNGEISADLVDDSGPDEEGTAEAIGFIELFNENSRITSDYWLYKDGGETLTEYFYNGSMLVRAETQTKAAGDDNGEYRKLYTDNYRYNRSYSLRRVERLYHGQAEAEPVYLVFPNRVLDVVSNTDFMKVKLMPGSDFMGSFSAGDGYRIVYDTDSRGRILTQTMTDENDDEVWVTRNTWSGDRIVSILRKEGNEEKLTEYEYDREGKRILQRDIHNGVLERLVYTKGENETEELFMDGVVVLRAYWENGRKIREERVRH